MKLTSLLDQLDVALYRREASHARLVLVLQTQDENTRALELAAQVLRDTEACDAIHKEVQGLLERQPNA